MSSRTKGSVPNVKRAVATGDTARANRNTKLQQQRRGSVGSGLNDSVSEAIRGPKRRNS